MDKCILVQHLNSINSVISETFKSTQRIKLTCFDVSEEYIVFGASSGGIYIFRREPCEFLKIIPSKEGSAIRIIISPKGRNIAFASSKGLLIILEDFLDVNVRPLVHSEHEGSIVTDLKWHGTTVYSGDSTGRVAVFSLSNLMTIFQTPYATLMHLDSSIVQIDTHSKYLLVSTKTRTYLCDTEKECYKQIGKKLRDGSFGACFSNATCNTPDTGQSFTGIFKTIKENESFMSSPIDSSEVKIYCSRPGARLWEANFEARVIVTHQFRNSLNQSPSNIIHLKDAADARMNVSTCKDVNEVSKDFNFNKIYHMLYKFIFTYNDGGIYFFDSTVSKLAFWSNRFRNIKEVAISGSYIYIWRNNMKINVISLELLEELIIKTLLNKQYYFCTELCFNYYDDVINLIEKSHKIHLISILKSKLVEIDATDLLEKVKPILQALEKFNKQRGGKKLANGIVVIENVHSEFHIPESTKDLSVPHAAESRSSTSSYVEGKATAEPLKNIGHPTHVEENTHVLALYKQFQLNKTHKNAELTESTDLMTKLSLDELLILFEDFIKYVRNLENVDAISWCREQFLKHASRKDFDLKTLEANTLSFLSDAFLETCNSSHLTCKCKYPLPKAHRNPPRYYDLGSKLFDSSDTVDKYLHTIPYMHKLVLSRLKTLTDIVATLPLIVQYNDEEILKQFLVLITYDTWDEIIKLFIKLRKGQCLNCDLSVDVDGICSWSDLGMLMIESIGPQNTTRLLKRYSQDIPNGSLDTKFYQCCIMASTVDQPGLAVKFMDNIAVEHVLPKFEDQLETFLQRKYLGCQNQPINYANSDAKCAFCDIPLRGSIFSDNKKCDCGHCFHALCFDFNKGMCYVCSTT